MTIPQPAIEAAAKANEVECPRCRGQGVFKRWPGDRSCHGATFITQEQADAYFERHQ